MSELNLVAMLLSTSGARYLPAVAMGAPPLPIRQVRFPDWWNAPVLKDKQGRKLSRRELVRHVTDTDGGAHVDPDLDQAYMDISRNNSLGWTFGNRDVMQALSGRPELAAMRQIAHEVLCTINRFVPEFSSDAVLLSHLSPRLPKIIACVGGYNIPLVFRDEVGRVVENREEGWNIPPGALG